MCKRPSRSLKSTVTALMRFSSVRYLMRSSWMVSAATRSRRCFLALRFSSSNSSYERDRKLRSSVVMFLLKGSYCENRCWSGERSGTSHKQWRIARGVCDGQFERATVLPRKIDKENRKREWNGRASSRTLLTRREWSRHAVGLGFVNEY